MATPNMNLFSLVPGPNGTPGPTYATEIVNNFNVIDQHDHTAGSGVAIPTAGLNINANLPVNGFSLTGIDRVQMDDRSAAPTGTANYRSLSVVNGDLYFLDDSGNSIQMTSSGSVNVSGTGNLGGISGSAGVNFLLATDAWQLIDDAGDRARLNAADLRVYEKGATSISNYVQLSSPGSLAASYTLTYPAALPASTGYLTSNSGGTLSFSTADQIGQGMTSTGANALLGVATDIGSNATLANDVLDEASNLGSVVTSQLISSTAITTSLTLLDTINISNPGTYLIITQIIITNEDSGSGTSFGIDNTAAARLSLGTATGTLTTVPSLGSFASRFDFSFSGSSSSLDAVIRHPTTLFAIAEITAAGTVLLNGERLSSGGISEAGPAFTIAVRLK